VKPDGYMFIADFAWVNQEHDNFWAGMYTKSNNIDENGKHREFEKFNFIIDKAPDSPFEIFHIPNHLMFKAGYEAGFSNISHTPQYPHPDYESDVVVRRYLDICKPSDYLMKFKF
jgi:hypothetical protein